MLILSLSLSLSLSLPPDLSRNLDKRYSIDNACPLSFLVRFSVTGGSTLTQKERKNFRIDRDTRKATNIDHRISGPFRDEKYAHVS
jgi:hypothetical protein